MRTIAGDWYDMGNYYKPNKENKLRKSKEKDENEGEWLITGCFWCIPTDYMAVLGRKLTVLITLAELPVRIIVKVAALLLWP